MSNLIRKITVKTVCGTPEKPEAPTALMRVIGHAQRVKEGTTDYGVFQKLLGTFEAVNLNTGEVSQSPQCILPEPANGMIAAQLIGENASDSIAFALEIGVKPSDRPGGTGYEFTTRPLVEVQTADPLADLRSQMKAITDQSRPEAEAETGDKKRGKRAA